jgi:predicted metal-dependent peptidase
MTFEKMTLNQRIQAANIDCMRHPQYALLSGVICMGKSEVSKTIPTAATNGRDKKYGEEFIQPLNRKQLRYLVLHENFHVALKHCILYRRETKAMPRLANIAQDYVVNALIEELDPDFTFVERPTHLRY